MAAVIGIEYVQGFLDRLRRILPPLANRGSAYIYQIRFINDQFVIQLKHICIELSVFKCA